MNRTTAPAPPRGVPVEEVPLLISRDYALLWGGQAISGLGDTLFQTTAVLWIATRLGYGVSWAPLAVAAVFLANVVPEFIVGPLAGVFVDRWDKRRTMLRMDLARAGLLGLLVLAAGRAAIPSVLHFELPRGDLLGVIYGTLALVTAAGQFFGPARLALIGDVVADAQRERASGLAQSSSSIAAIVGPALAAPLFVTGGAGWALGLDALSFLVSFGAIALVKVPQATVTVQPGERAYVGRELMAGVRLILSTSALATLLVVGMLISVGFGALEPLEVFFLQQNLHAPATLFGLLGGALGAGTLLGAAAGGPLAERAGVGRLLWMASFCLGLLFVMFARLTSFVAALAVLFLVGATFAVLEVAETPLLLRATPREFLGRVTALLVPLFGLASAVASVAAGWLASAPLRAFHVSVLGVTLSTLDTIIAGAGVLVLGGGLYARINAAAIPARRGASCEEM